MAHGTAGIRGQLKQYVPRFTAAGLHVLLFDYRHFGDSAGQPRQLLSIRRQLQDYAAALEFIRRVPGVDPDRVAVWGSSLAGGHVVDVAVRDGRVAAVISQNPAMDNVATAFRIVEYAGIGQILKLAGLGIVDMARSLLWLSPKMVPAGGAPGELAMMTSSDTLAGLNRLATPGWRNELCARISLSGPFHRPGLKAHRLPCPILIAICDKDSVAPTGRRSHCSPGGPTRDGQALPYRSFRHLCGRVVRAVGIGSGGFPEQNPGIKPDTVNV